MLTGRGGVQIETPLLVDTGAALTVLSYRAARTLDLELARPLHRTSFVFAEGGTQAPVVQLPRLQLGALFVDDLSVGILSLPPGLGVDGLLGMDVYQRLGIRRLTLELDTATLVLRR